MLDILKEPWTWYVAGPLIGLVVPLLLLLGNKSFGISSSLRQICASCIPTKIPYFQYDWKIDIWKLYFVVGIMFGGAIATYTIQNQSPIEINGALVKDLSNFNINDHSSFYPIELFSFKSLFTLRGFIIIILGGFFVGFGTRYAGGCTSGHAIMGISNLHWPAIVATICFMIGGFITTNLLLPFILAL